MFSVGAMYDGDRGTPVDRSEAIGGYRTAAGQENGRAADNLGVIFRDGDGVSRNAAVSVTYFRLAALTGIAVRRPAAGIGRVATITNGA